MGGGKSSRDRCSFAASLVREKAVDAAEEDPAPVSGVVVVPPALDETLVDEATSAFSSGGDPPGDKSLGDKSPSLP